MHILLICKLATKHLEIKNQSKRHKQPQNQENYTKTQIFSQKYVQKGYITPPHLNLTMSSFGAEETQPGTKIETQKTKRTKQDTNIYKLTHKTKT